MKTIIKVFIILTILSGYSCSASRTGMYPYGQQNRYESPYFDSYQVFYDQLSPYGYWVENPEYGYVWIPDAGRNFFPYVTNGNWLYTDYGWTWLSNYEWGWAPFHYGRWDFDNYYGWFWVPDDQWGPSWVIWRRANGYYGWAPMRPGMSVRMGITGGNRDLDRWSFVREKDFGRTDIGRRYINRRNNEDIFRNSTVINNTYIDNRRNATYISGPRPDDVRRVTGRRINTVAVNDSDRPGSRVTSSELNIYRPEIRRGNDSRAVPPRVSDPSSVRSAEERRSAGVRRNNDYERERRNTEVQGSREQGSNPSSTRPSSRREQVENRRNAQGRERANRQSDEQNRQQIKDQREKQSKTQPQEDQTEEKNSGKDINSNDGNNSTRRRF